MRKRSLHTSVFTGHLVSHTKERALLKLKLADAPTLHTVCANAFSVSNFGITKAVKRLYKSIWALEASGDLN